ncbi:MAG: ABC transporter substrate-binding protein [Candidatus Rokubacteria bacterium]|nr:ABC transporter substrate-binding protein [Candidatus Rokubacteria bacterium]
MTGNVRMKCLAGLFAVAVMALAADATAQKRGGTLITVVHPEPSTLASYLSTAATIGEIAAKIYEGLLEYDFDLNPQPGLAKSWAVGQDGKTLTFKLQDNVKFHDGKPFTSADVKFTVLEVLRKVHPRGASTFKEVADIETPDPHTAVFKLNNPAPYMMPALSGNESPMLPKHLFEGTDVRNNPYANKPIGTGPFKFVEWRKAQFIRLDRNDAYWKKGPPYLDRVVARFVPEASTRTAALESGEVHLAAFNALPFVDVQRFRNMSGMTYTTRGYETLNPLLQLEINTKRPPFDNKKVRQAIAYAIDRQFIIDNIWFGLGKPATGPLNSNFKRYYTADVKRYHVPNRVEIANRLLDEAGQPRGANGIRFKIVHDIDPYGDHFRQLGQYIKQALGQIGIEVELREEDPATWIKRVYTDYDFTLNQVFFYGLPDPVLGVHRQYICAQIRKGVPFVNSTHYCNPEVDKLAEQASVEINEKKRAELYKKFQQIIVEDSPIVFISEVQWPTVYSSKLKDLIVSPLGVLASFDRAWVAQ